MRQNRCACLSSSLSQEPPKIAESLCPRGQRWLFESRRYENVETLCEWVIREAEFQAVASETVHGLASSESSYPYRKSHQGPVRNQRAQILWQSNMKLRRGASSALTVVISTAYRTASCSIRFMCRNTGRLQKDNRLCFRCLSDSNIGTVCPCSRECGVDSCSKSHHHLLHQHRDLTSPVAIT